MKLNGRQSKFLNNRRDYIKADRYFQISPGGVQAGFEKDICGSNETNRPFQNKNPRATRGFLSGVCRMWTSRLRSADGQ